MSDVIKINRSTVRRNPTAGRSAYQIAGRPSVREVYVDGVLVERTVHQPVQTLYSLTPEGEFLYEYEDPVVTCDCCNERRQLSSYEYGIDEAGNDYYNCNGCGCEYAIYPPERETLDRETLTRLAEENEKMNAP